MRRRHAWIALAALAATLLVVARDDRDPPAAPAGAQEAAVNRLAPRATGTPAVHPGPATPPGRAVSPALPRVAPLAPAVASIDRAPSGEPGDGDAALLVEDPPGESPSEASDSDAPRDADDPLAWTPDEPEEEWLEIGAPRDADDPLAWTPDEPEEEWLEIGAPRDADDAEEARIGTPRRRRPLAWTPDEPEEERLEIGARDADDPASEALAAPGPDILERDEPRHAHAPGRPPF